MKVGSYSLTFSKKRSKNSWAKFANESKKNDKLLPT